MACVLICAESTYNMDGNVMLPKELIGVAKKLFSRILFTTLEINCLTLKHCFHLSTLFAHEVNAVSQDSKPRVYICRLH